jgi:hypothetical protein
LSTEAFPEPLIPVMITSSRERWLFRGWRGGFALVFPSAVLARSPEAFLRGI